MEKIEVERCPFCEVEIPGGRDALLNHMVPCSLEDATKKIEASGSPATIEALKKVLKVNEIVNKFTSASEEHKKLMVVCPECLGYGYSPLPRSICAECRIRMIPIGFFIETNAPGSVNFPRA